MDMKINLTRVLTSSALLLLGLWTYAQVDTVHLAYRSVTENDLLGGVSYINMEELSEKNYNTYSLDNLQGYVGGWNGNSLWGFDGDNAGYLVLVDGIPRDANNVQPTEIEQISFLKGANAAILYGSRAAKGAILITTKRGKVDGLRVSIRANEGVDIAKSYPEYLGSAEYMTYFNEARVNDGLEPRYTSEDIYNYGSGSNPYRYPSLNFYSDEFIRNWRNRTEAVAEINGGGGRAHFYSNIGYYRASDFYKFGQAEDAYTSRLNVRGNVDMKIGDFISAFINANTTFYDSAGARGDYWNAAANFRPNRVSPLIPLGYIDPNAPEAIELVGTSSNIYNGMFLGGTQLDQDNIFADYYAAGSSKYTSRQFQFDAGIGFDLDSWVRGLSFKTVYAVDYANVYTTSFQNTYASFEPVWSNYAGEDRIVSITKYNNDEKNGVQNIGDVSARMTTFLTAQFDYSRSFGEHNVNGLLVASGWRQTRSGVYHRTGSAHTALNGSYNYAHKYYADATLSLMHTAKLAPGRRNSLSASLTLGWRLKNEDFLKDSEVVDDLLLSISATDMKQDIDIAYGDSQYFLYESVWTQAYGSGWYDGSQNLYTYSTRGKNYELGPISRKELAAGLRASLLDGMFKFDANAFFNRTDGLITLPSSYPSHLNTSWPDASFVPYTNFNANDRYGFDFAVQLNRRFGELDLSLGLAGTCYNTVASKRDEIQQEEYQKRQGLPLDGIWGYECLGFFGSQEEIDSAPSQEALGSTVRPGDLRYKDQNDDKVIDSYDQIYLGKGGWYGNPLSLGVNLTLKWHNLTFFALGTAGMGSYGLKNNDYYWISGEDKYSAVVRGRWTPETAGSATYPRLTSESGSNNLCSSDFWMYKTDRFDLAKVQLTYDFPMTGSKIFSGLSVYVSGSNLLTLSKEREYMEMNVGTAPQTRFYNLGVKATF